MLAPMRAWSLVVAFLVVSFAPRVAASGLVPGGDPITAALQLSAARLSFEAPATPFTEVQLLPLERLEVRAASALPALSAPSTLAAASPAEAGSSATASAPAGHRYGWALEDSRVYWYTAGASAVTSLAARVVLIIPAYLIGAIAVASGLALNPVVATIVTLAVVAGFTVVDAAISGLIASLTFNSVSRFYESDFLTGFAGHLAGNVLSAGAFWLVFGFGGMLIAGLDFVTPFTVNGVAQMLLAFSTLGVLPALVVTFIAGVAVPALVGAWALSATARPRDGYAIDPTWRPYETGTAAERALPEERRLRAQVVIPLPGT